MKKELTCIVCPMGCHLSVELDEAGLPVSVEGNRCPRGAAYAKDELTHPTRTLTSTVRLANREGRMLSVKTNRPISKGKLFDAMEILRTVAVEAPVSIGDVIVADLFGEADVVATENVD